MRWRMTPEAGGGGEKPKWFAEIIVEVGGCRGN